MVVLSIHLITYNNEKHIDETIQSILKQRVNFKYEVVVGDDCSTDNTLELINRYALKHENIFKVQQNKVKLGILKNFKNTLDRCSGSYVFDIAGDDKIKSEFALQKMVDAFKSRPNLGFVDSGYDRLNENDGSITLFENKNLLNAPSSSYKESILLGKVAPIGHCYKKDFLYKYVEFDTYLKMNVEIEDYPILVDLVMQTEFDKIDESLHIYRVHDNSYSHSKELEQIIFQKNQMKNLFEYFSKKHNFSKQLISRFQEYHNKELLFLAGYFQNIALGKESFSKIHSKSVIDMIHYLASQNKYFRKLISFKKSFYNLFKNFLKSLI